MWTTSLLLKTGTQTILLEILSSFPAFMAQLTYCSDIATAAWMSSDLERTWIVIRDLLGTPRLFKSASISFWNLDVILKSISQAQQMRHFILSTPSSYALGIRPWLRRTAYVKSYRCPCTTSTGLVNNLVKLVFMYHCEDLPESLADLQLPISRTGPLFNRWIGVRSAQLKLFGSKYSSRPGGSSHSIKNALSAWRKGGILQLLSSRSIKLQKYYISTQKLHLLIANDLCTPHARPQRFELEAEAKIKRLHSNVEKQTLCFQVYYDGSL